MRRACPYRGENPGPGKDVRGELDPGPGIREQPRSFATGAFNIRADQCPLSDIIARRSEVTLRANFGLKRSCKIRNFTPEG